MAGENIQALDHAEGMKRGPGRLGPDIGHAKDLVALQFFFQVGDEVQELGVGIEQILETGISKAEDRGDLVPEGRALGGFPPPIKVPEEIEGLHHMRL